MEYDEQAQLLVNEKKKSNKYESLNFLILIIGIGLFSILILIFFRNNSFPMNIEGYDNHDHNHINYKFEPLSKLI